MAVVAVAVVAVVVVVGGRGEVLSHVTFRFGESLHNPLKNSCQTFWALSGLSTSSQTTIPARLEQWFGPISHACPSVSEFVPKERDSRSPSEASVNVRYALVAGRVFLVDAFSAGLVQGITDYDGLTNCNEGRTGAAWLLDKTSTSMLIPIQYTATCMQEACCTSV